MPQLSASVIDTEDALAAIELYYTKGWTDGFPIVPPTERAVSAFLDEAGLEPGDVIGVEPVRDRPLTAEKLAINAVMAGCEPSYFPVVVAVIDAMCDSHYLFHGSGASTGGSAPFIVVNGPIRREIGMNSTNNILANGSRANATIGRAIRLIMLNLLDCIPGELDRSTLGHPGKFTLCIAEDEEDSPWLPLATERGVPVGPGQSAVTVVACESPHQIVNEWTHDPEEILDTLAADMRTHMLVGVILAGNYALVIPKQLRDIIVAAGWDKKMIREYMYENVRVNRKDWAGVGKANLVDSDWLADKQDENGVFKALNSPDELLVVAAGGPAGGMASIIPPWKGGNGNAFAVTKPIRVGR